MLVIKYIPIGNNYFQVNLFCIYCGRSTPFISYSSLIYWWGTYETSTRKDFRPTKILTRKNLDPRNTHEKKFQTHEIPTRKKLQTHESTVARWYEAQETHDGTRLTEFSTIVKSITSNLVSVKLVTFNIMNNNIEQIQYGAIIGARW